MKAKEERHSGPRSVDLVPVYDIDQLALPDSSDADERAWWAECEEQPPTGIRRVRSDLTITDTFVDWEEVARRAGLGEWGASALNYKARGISLYGALREQADDEDRKALRAAWARMERRLQAGKIKEILQKPEFSTGANVSKSARSGD